jgi:hypothetical protein
MLPAKTRQDLELARREIEWIDDHDLRDLESRSRVGAALLGLFTWGGGRVYTGDLVRGIGAIVLLIGWLMLGSALPGGVTAAGYWLGGALGAAWSVRGARSINRFCAIRNELLLSGRPGGEHQHLLAGAVAAPPALATALPPPAPAAAPATGPYAPLIDRLHKLASLRQAGVIDDSEHRSRKIDVLGQAASAVPAAELEDLMFALLPLRNDGVLLAEDFEFMKQLGGER